MIGIFWDTRHLSIQLSSSADGALVTVRKPWPSAGLKPPKNFWCMDIPIRKGTTIRPGKNIQTHSNTTKKSVFKQVTVKTSRMCLSTEIMAPWSIRKSQGLQDTTTNFFEFRAKSIKKQHAEMSVWVYPQIIKHGNKHGCVFFPLESP